jgi:Fe2+ transport system protein FeoA
LRDSDRAVDQNTRFSVTEVRRALCDLPPGTHGIVRALQGDTYFITVLASRCLTVGSEVKVLRNSGRGLLLLMVRDTFLALGRSEAARIEVELITAQEEPVEPEN